MAKEKSPAFQFYPKEFLTDGHVAAMSLKECGAYIKLLCLCWQEESITSDPQRLANMVGVSRREFQKLWPALEPCFIEEGATLRHGRLDLERGKQAAYREQQRLKGLASAVARSTGRQPDSNHGSTAVQPDTEPDGNQDSTERQPSSQPKTKSPISDLSTTYEKKVLTYDRFDEFWDTYPRKVGKDAAKRAYLKRRPDADLHARMLAAIDRQARDPAWRKDGGQFVPHPATWLNAGRWEDEPAAVPRAMEPSRWQDDCTHDPPCTNATNCANRHAIEAYKAEHAEAI